jgi:undecaprenyl-diphosphatase
MSHLSNLQAITIGLLQGVTELFPISSLGHSVLVPALIGGSWRQLVTQGTQDESPYLVFIVGLHVATALALLCFFWRDWVRLVKAFFRTLAQRQVRTVDERLAWLIIIGTIPAGILGIALEHTLRTVFAKPVAASAFLVLNGVILFGAELLRRRSASTSVAEHTPGARHAAGGAVAHGGAPVSDAYGARAQAASGYPAGAHAAGMPAVGPSAGGMPAAGPSAGGMPTGSAPATGMPTGGAHAAGMPAGGAHAAGMPTGTHAAGAHAAGMPTSGGPADSQFSAGGYAGAASGTRAAGSTVPGTHAAGSAALGDHAGRRPHGAHAAGPAGATLETATPESPEEADRGVVAKLSRRDAGLIGVFQSLALLAGISRSGITMAAGLLRGLDHEQAVRFAFLLATPIILAAGVYKLPELAGPTGNGIHLQVLLGSIAAFIGALISIRFLTRYFQTRTLTPFAIYCVVFGVICLAYFS